MTEENNSPIQNDNVENDENSIPKVTSNIETEQTEENIDPTNAAKTIQSTILGGFLGHVNFDSGIADNTISEAMVSEDCRRRFQRDVYVGIKDTEQNIEFLGRIVEGPFHTPHEIGVDSAITRTTILHPERTKFRPSYYVFGNIEVLGRLLTDEQLIPTSTRPRPYSDIYIFPPERLSKLLDIQGNSLLGYLMGYEQEKIEVKANLDNKNFLPRNVGVFGTIGSGKSNTVQTLVEEACKAGWASIIIDVEGEYVRMNEPEDRVEMIAILKENFGVNPEGIHNFIVYVPSSGGSDAEHSIRFKVPLSHLETSIIGDILEFTEAQIRMFERVIEWIRRSSNQPSQNRMGMLSNEENQQQSFAYTLQNVLDTLRLPAFLTTIQQYEQITANTLRNKLFYILGNSGMLDWDKTNSINYLPVNDLLVGGRLSVFDVSETDDRSRNIAIAYILQSLFNKIIETPVGEKLPNTDINRPKVLVVIEEVHTFVSRQSVNKMRAVLDNLQIISRRGRKRWMSLALVSQQPGHVPDELFELANTRFIHQLKSAMNLAPVKQTTGGVHEALWETIPSLGPGQCLLTGSTFRNPLFVQIRPAKSKRLLTN